MAYNAMNRANGSGYSNGNYSNGNTINANNAPNNPNFPLNEPSTEKVYPSDRLLSYKQQQALIGITRKHGVGWGGMAGGKCSQYESGLQMAIDLRVLEPAINAAAEHEEGNFAEL